MPPVAFSSSAPPLAVRAAVGIKETFESLRYVQYPHPRRRPRWYNPGY